MARYLSRETEPYGKWKGIPIYLTTILTAVFVLGLIAMSILRAGRSPLLDILILKIPLESAAGIIGMVTYPFMGLPNFFTPFAIICFYWWSTGIETHLGRRPLVTLLLLLTALPQVFGWLAWGFAGIPTMMAGNYLLTVGLIVAFATLYPSVEVWGWIPFKYFAAMCIACGLLISIGDRAWADVVSMVALCLMSFLFIRHAIEQEYDDHVPLTARLRGWFRRKPKIRVLPNPGHTTYRERARSSNPPACEFDDVSEEVDALLDKIAKSGIDSLTPAEKARLEKARQELLKKERR